MLGAQIHPHVPHDVDGREQGVGEAPSASYFPLHCIIIHNVLLILMLVKLMMVRVLLLMVLLRVRLVLIAIFFEAFRSFW